MEIKYKLAEEYSEKEVLKYDLGNQVEVEDFDFLCQTHFIAGYEAAQRWISVDELLPSLIKDKWYSDDVFLTDDDSFETGFYNSELKRWIIYGDSQSQHHFKPTHWLPIPKLPTK